MIEAAKIIDTITDRLFDAMDKEVLAITSRLFTSKPSALELENMNSSGLHPSMSKLYADSDGLTLGWTATEDQSVGGNIQFNKHIWLLRNDQSLIDQCEMDPNMDERLRQFRVWDIPTMNTIVGFIHDSETGFSKILYFYTQGARYAKSLDLDVDGYLDMAYESAAFYYWQQVLLDIKNETESPETRKFKEWMPKLFPDFSWEAFVEKYQELRLD